MQANYGRQDERTDGQAGGRADRRKDERFDRGVCWGVCRAATSLCRQCMKCWKMIPSASGEACEAWGGAGAWHPMQVHLTFMLDAVESAFRPKRRRISNSFQCNRQKRVAHSSGSCSSSRALSATDTAVLWMDQPCPATLGEHHQARRRGRHHQRCRKLFTWCQQKLLQTKSCGHWAAAAAAAVGVVLGASVAARGAAALQRDSNCQQTSGSVATIIKCKRFWDRAHNVSSLKLFYMLMHMLARIVQSPFLFLSLYLSFCILHFKVIMRWDRVPAVGCGPGHAAGRMRCPTSCKIYAIISRRSEHWTGRGFIHVGS